VLGCGPIGTAIIAALSARGVETIVASDFSPKRRELATAMGAHQTLDPAQGSPFDSVKAAVVFEAVGVPGIIDDVLLRARHGTRLVVAGSACNRHRAPVLRHRQRDQRAILTGQTRMSSPRRCARWPRARSTSPR